MTSELKTKANRANSRASTGPRTQYGRGRAARNALRHGLSLPVCSDPVLSEEVDALAREIVGGDSNAELQHSARRIAEAQIDLRRIRQARHQLLTNALRDPSYDRATVKTKRRRDAPEFYMVALLNVSSSTPQGHDILSQEAKRLDALDRYERRARTRLNLAVQLFDREVACKSLENNLKLCFDKTKPKT
jgi:hypothetical protein